MGYDLYAELHGESKEDVNALVKGEWRNFKIQDIATRIQLLTGVAATGTKDYAVSGDRKQGGGYKSLVHRERASGRTVDASPSLITGYKSLVHRERASDTPYAKELIQVECKRLAALGLLKPDLPKMALLPFGSLFLQFDFTLATPYISKDDELFYMTESVNPVRKDKVFKIPMCAASSWKGALRWTANQIHLVNQAQQLRAAEFAQRRFSLARLFGDEKGEEGNKPDDLAKFLNELKPEATPLYRQMLRHHFSVDEKETLPHHRGRLLCYPTFFDLIDIEVINPHSRETKAGKQPIYFESVPAGATGTFTLLYVPFDRIGEDAAETRAEVAEDLTLIAEGVQAMLTLYGFGAKTSSGFGLAVNAVRDGIVVVGGLPYEAEPSVPDAVPPAPAQPDLPRYLAAPFRLDPDFVSETGGLKSEAEYQRLITGRGQRYAKKDKQLYDKAKSWWEREGQQLAQQPEPEVELEPTPEIPPSYPLASETLDTFNDLPVKTQKLANALRQAKGSEA